MSAGTRLRAVLSGLLAGATGGLFGVGGGIVIVPLLTGWFGATQHQAHGTSLATVGATALASLFVYGAHGNVRWSVAAVVGLASVLAARWGARLASRVPGPQLTRAFALFLVLVALRLLWKAPLPGTGLDLDHGAVGLATDLALGLLVGLLAGFMGVGGGVLAVPAFTLLLGMSQQAAQGTSLAVILVTAPAGALEHHRRGNLMLSLVPWLALGAAVGGPLTSGLAQSLPSEWLTRGFALFLLATAAHSWLRAARAASR